MKSAAFIRCNSVSRQELELRARLEEHFGEHVFLIVDNLTGEIDPSEGPDRCIYITRDALDHLGLPVFNKVGWRCGDYCYYVADRHLGGKYDFYWLIENDVAFSFDSLSDFFGPLDEVTTDFLAPTYGKRGEHWFWYDSIAPLVGPENVRGCLFPISRISRAAVPRLLQERRDIWSSACGSQAKPTQEVLAKIPNDEAFVSSFLFKWGFSCENLVLRAPAGALSPETFHSEFPVMPEEVTLTSRKNRVLHPVRNKQGAAWKFQMMREKHKEVYAKKRAFITEAFGEQVWKDWSGEEESGVTSDNSEETAKMSNPAITTASSSLPPVFVHVGFHKTGTTFLQALFKRNEDQLSDYHIINQRDPNSRALRAACQELLRKRQKDDAEVKKNIEEQFRLVGEAAGERKIIISDEEMFGFIPGRHGYWKLYDRATDIMDCARNGLKDREVRFFAYTRPRMKWLASVYAEAVKNHHLDIDYDEFLLRLEFDQSLDQLSAEIQNKMGEYVFQYAPMSADNGTTFGLGTALLDWMGFSDETKAKLVKPGRANESVPRNIQEAFLILNRAGLPGPQLMDVKNRILAALRA